MASAILWVVRSEHPHLWKRYSADANGSTVTEGGSSEEEDSWCSAIFKVERPLQIGRLGEWALHDRHRSKAAGRFA